MRDESGRGSGGATSSSVGHDHVVLRQADYARIWMPLVWLVTGLLVGTLQLVRGSEPWWFMFVAGAGLTFWLGRRPLVVADASGVVFRGKDPLPWSEIAEVVKPPDDGWKHHSTELVLRDGTRRTFGVDVERADVERLCGWWAQAQRTGP
jgi:hypothetical protein